ncbi:hypothetical protein BJ742DRAFT_735587 [Cladochytrium replicatum]|nr:hypothetical protein BJ742DRAFT_735587 [Cladochytrium replicatum]
MVSNSHNPAVVKQGYAYKRGKGHLSQWRLKFIVVLSYKNASAGSTDALLQVFDQRANAFAKHTLALNPGTIVSVPAQSKGDRDEWVQSLKKYVGQLLDPRSSSAVPLPIPRGNLISTVSRGTALPPNLPIRHKRSSTVNSAFMRLGGSISCRRVIFMGEVKGANPDEIDEAKAKTSQALRALDGFRMVAYADVPLSHKTMVQKVHADCLCVDDGAVERLAIVGKSIHLRSHSPLLSQTQTYYAVNIHDMFPMDYYPARNNEEKNRRNNSHHTMTETELQTGQDPTKRLRAEFLRAYGDKLNISLVSDAFTLCSGANTREREVADTEAMRAARFLREQLIPSFIKRLETLIVRPVDSMTLSLEMHRAGVNIRYLGYIAKLSQVPDIRDLVCIEMAARASKDIFQSRLRGAILHFRSVGATNIDDEMRVYMANWFSTVLGVGERTCKLKPEIMEKYDYLLPYEHFMLLHKPAIFLAMQHQCGVLFEDTIDYNFATQNPVPKARFVRFQTRVKHVSGMPFELVSSGKSGFGNGSTLPAHIFQNEDDRIAYRLARHFKSLDRAVWHAMSQDA